MYKQTYLQGLKQKKPCAKQGFFDQRALLSCQHILQASKILPHCHRGDKLSESTEPVKRLMICLNYLY